MKADQSSANNNSPNSDNYVRHDAWFNGTAIHFTMTTRAHSSIDLKRAAQRLLAADLAVAAAWPSESDVLVAPRFQRLASSLRKVERYRDDFHAFEYKNTFGAFLRLIRHRPLSVFRNLAHRREQDACDAEIRTEDTLSQIDDALELAASTIVNPQIIPAIERKFDANLFNRSTSGEDTFVRLTIRNSYHDIQIPATDETVHVTFEPRLIIYSFGVAQITIALYVDRQLTTQQLVQLARSDCGLIVKSQMAEPLLKGVPTHKLGGRWLDKRDAGARLREFVFDTQVTMAQALEAHLSAIGSAIRKELPREWHAYATILTTAGDCCDPSSWSREHQEDIARIATRYNRPKRVRHEKLVGPNFSLDSDSILMTNLASTTMIQIHGDPPKPIEHLNTVLLVEHVLVQYFRLRLLEESVSSSSLFGARLQAAQQEAVSAFTAMRQYEINYGSARDIATYLLNDLGGTEMRRTIETALGFAAQANATRDASIQARRSLALTWVGTVLAVLVAIPTLSELLVMVKKTPADSPLATLLSPLIWAADLGTWGPWLVVAVLLAGTIGWQLLKHLSTLLAMAWRRAPRMGRSSKRLPREYVIKVHVEEN